VRTRRRASETLGWFPMALGVVIVLWSVDAFVVGPPNMNELDIIDLLLCVVVAGTLGAIGLRVRGLQRAALRNSALEPGSCPG
jgi:hypothetical protein